MCEWQPSYQEHVFPHFVRVSQSLLPPGECMACPWSTYWLDRRILHPQSWKPIRLRTSRCSCWRQVNLTECDSNLSPFSECSGWYECCVYYPGNEPGKERRRFHGWGLEFAVHPQTFYASNLIPSRHPWSENLIHRQSCKSIAIK